MIKFRTEKKMVPIDSICPNPWNPNFMDKFMFDKAKKSVKEIGFLGSILVRQIEMDGLYQILDGEHRWKILKEEGATECPVEIIIGEMTDEEAKLLTILINNLRGKDDIFKRAKILEALNEGQLQLLPMTEQEIEHEKKFVVFDFDQYGKDSSEEEADKKFAQVVVLPFNDEEAMVWKEAKEIMMKKGILKEKSKKKQDIAMVMILIKEFLTLAVGSLPDQDNQFQLEVSK